VVELILQKLGHTVADFFGVEDILNVMLQEEICKAMTFIPIQVPSPRGPETVRAFNFTLTKREYGVEDSLDLRMDRFRPSMFDRHFIVSVYTSGVIKIILFCRPLL